MWHLMQVAIDVLLFCCTALDYNATVLSAVIPPALRVSEIIFLVDIFDDTVSENREVFFVCFRVVNGSEQDVVGVTRTCSTVRIRVDATDGKSVT